MVQVKVLLEFYQETTNRCIIIIQIMKQNITSTAKAVPGDFFRLR
jgi:hypothetical protein